MSLLTTKGVYGLMALSRIAAGSETAPVSLKEMSEFIGVSKNYLEQILLSLRNAGIVNSVKGLRGGYFLARSADDISLYEVFCALEKDFCVTNLGVEQPEFALFFEKCEGELRAMFDKPLSSMDAFANDAQKYLNYVI